MSVSGGGGGGGSCVSVAHMHFFTSSFQHGLKIECMLQYVAGYPGIFSHRCILWGQAGHDDLGIVSHSCTLWGQAGRDDLGTFSHRCKPWGQACRDDLIQSPDLNRLAHDLSNLSQDLSEGWAALLWSLWVRQSCMRSLSFTLFYVIIYLF